MKKKLLILLLSVAAVFACAFALSACIGEPAHKHSYKVSVVAPTCTEQGYTLHTCSCGDNYKDTYVSALGHDTVHHDGQAATCAQVGWKAYDTCTRCDYSTYEELFKLEHSFKGGYCSVCGTPQPSEGLEYTLSDNGTYYIVSGIGTCTDIEVVIAERYNGLPVTTIGESAFYNCSGLTSATIPDSVTEIGYQAFYECSGLTSVAIGNGVTSIGDYAFRGCSGLLSITIPDSVTTIGGFAFEGCSRLTSITIPDSVISIGYLAFWYCSGLESINVSNGNNSYSSRDGILYDKSQTEILCIPASVKGSITIPDSVTSIGESAFSNRRGLTSITIPDSVTSIGDGAFYNCSELTSIIIPDGVTSIGSWTFCGCSGLTSITIPDGVTSIGNEAFCECSGLTSINIPDSVTSIGNYAFEYCSELTGVTIGNGVTSICESAFSGCSGLTSITIPDSVTTIGNYAFDGCSGLTSITIPSNVTSIGERAFYNCSELTEINFGGTVEQWNEISKGTNWNYGTGDYTVHCTYGDLSK